MTPKQDELFPLNLSSNALNSFSTKAIHIFDYVFTVRNVF